MNQSEGTGRERKGEISQRRKQNEIIIITILAVIMTAVMFANILENPKISDQSANEKGKMEKISNKTKTDGINNKKNKEKRMINKNDWKLVLVNGKHKIKENYDITVTPIGYTQAIDERCYDNLKNMINDCRNAGYNPVICSSHRSHEKQVLLFENKIKDFIGQGYTRKEAKKKAGTVVAIPGTSEHEIGLAVDIVDVKYQLLEENQEKTETQKWLMKNCWKYGFILRYPKDKQEITGVIYEPWHYRFVGKENAKMIMKNNLCLEEYLE
ncbi:MAG: M15 family metallopeptidase [Eubacterium sp.]|nr:M15 family metallopeptidase [Eubacterium sp.]